MLKALAKLVDSSFVHAVDVSLIQKDEEDDVISKQAPD
jgi:hypothetical protein